MKIKYSQNLKDHLSLLKKVSEELANEESEKTIEQFTAEVKFIMNLLEEIKKQSS